jgi:hypothetical protein
MKRGVDSAEDWHYSMFQQCQGHPESPQFNIQRTTVTAVTTHKLQQLLIQHSLGFSCMDYFNSPGQAGREGIISPDYRGGDWCSDRGKSLLRTQAERISPRRAVSGVLSTTFTDHSSFLRGLRSSLLEGHGITVKSSELALLCSVYLGRSCLVDRLRREVFCLPKNTEAG